MRRVLWVAALVVAVAYVGIATALYAAQRRLIFVPDTARPDADRAAIPGLREIELITADGLHLLAWYVPPPSGRPVLAYFHGNGGTLSDRVPRLRRFAQAGWGVFMAEYRGYGGNPGSPSERGFAADAQSAMAFLRSEGFGGDRIVVYGESIGTGVAVRVASEQDIAVLILESPYTSIAAIAARRFFFLPVGLLLKDRFDSLSRIGRVRAPVLVLQGARDDIVPPDLGRELFDAANNPKELWTAPEAGHADLMAFGAFETIVRFVALYVPASRSVR